MRWNRLLAIPLPQRINAINVINYYWKGYPSTLRSTGVLAHELKELYPEYVSGQKDGERMQTVNYAGLIPHLVSAIQALTKRVEELES